MTTIAVIGCGRIADGAHFPALMKMDEVRIKYACDLILEKAEKAKESLGEHKHLSCQAKSVSPVGVLG